MDEKHIPLLPELAGEASPGAYGARTGDGKIVNPEYAIFPIVKYPQEKMHLIGTGFFISTTGLFVTVKHVLMDPFDPDGKQKYPISIIQMLPGNIFYARPILRCTSHAVADVAVGVAAPMEHRVHKQPLINPVVTLDMGSPVIGTRVVTYAYPKHSNIIEADFQRVDFKPTWYDGYLNEYLPHGRDNVLLPGFCFRTSIHIHSGASGGPVYGPSGRVFGVNSTGIDGTDISYASSVADIRLLLIHDVSIGGLPPRPVRISELIDAGHILAGA